MNMKNKSYFYIFKTRGKVYAIFKSKSIEHFAITNVTMRRASRVPTTNYTSAEARNNVRMTSPT